MNEKHAKIFTTMSILKKLTVSMIIVVFSFIIIKGSSSSAFQVGYPLSVEVEVYNYLQSEINNIVNNENNEGKFLVAFIDVYTCPTLLYNLHEYYTIAQQEKDFFVFVNTGKEDQANDFLELSGFENIDFMYNSLGLSIDPTIMSRIFLIDLYERVGVSNITLHSNVIDSFDLKKKLLSDLNLLL
ncbi:MAG: hypothetical protein LAT51_13350 [Flavobacteriaceae bacterium]|nr:hypothetical protein [Flavobacteriaceae bacterium]